MTPIAGGSLQVRGSLFICAVSAVSLSEDFASSTVLLHLPGTVQYSDYQPPRGPGDPLTFSYGFSNFLPPP